MGYDAARQMNAGDAAAAQTDTYTRTTGTNRLASVTTPAGTRTINYDSRGNTASETRPASVAATVAYDGYGRLTGYARTGDATQANVYNGLDDRVQVTSGSTVRRYLYDGDGRLLGEYGASAAAANVTAEWIWLEPEAANDNAFGGDDGTGGYAPIGVAVGSAGTLNWVHTSHLGAPLLYTTSTGAVTTAPAALLPGFPGQLRTFADLFYNRYRDYDPTTGRYIQADPIGLEGGENLYVYADANPLRFIDPEGLAPPYASPPKNIPGGPWIDINGQGSNGGRFYGPKLPGLPRTICQYVPPTAEGGPPGVDKGYWKFKGPGQPGWKYYNNRGGSIPYGHEQDGRKPGEPPKIPWGLGGRVLGAIGLLVTPSPAW